MDICRIYKYIYYRKDDESSIVIFLVANIFHLCSVYGLLYRRRGEEVTAQKSNKLEI